MNVFNRIVVVLLDVAMLAAAAAVLLVTLGVDPARIAPTGWLEDGLATFEGLDTADRIWTVVGVIAVLVLGVVLFTLEWPRPAARAEREIPLRTGELGRVTVTREGVEDLASREAAAVPGVQRFTPRVDEDEGTVRIRGRALVDPDSNVQEVALEVQRRVKSAVEQHLGLQVTDVTVDARLASRDGARQAPRVQ